MVGIAGLNGEAPVQVKLAQRLMMERTLEAADRMVACLESLYAQFPSTELREALHNTTSWRNRLCDWLEGQRSCASSPGVASATQQVAEQAATA
jgi:hypothetical protein